MVAWSAVWVVTERGMKVGGVESAKGERRTGGERRMVRSEKELADERLPRRVPLSDRMRCISRTAECDPEWAGVGRPCRHEREKQAEGWMAVGEGGEVSSVGKGRLQPTK